MRFQVNFQTKRTDHHSHIQVESALCVHASSRNLVVNECLHLCGKVTWILLPSLASNNMSCLVSAVMCDN